MILQSVGDTFLAYQCYRLALVHNSDHAESFNNIGVLEMRKGHPDTARAFFQTAASLASHLYEPHFNFASLADKVIYLCKREQTCSDFNL